jgi:aminoglycoside 6'-N-acetyltransferase I
MTIAEINNEDTIIKCAQIFMSTNNAPPWNDEWNIEKSVILLLDIFHAPKFYGLVCYFENELIGFVLGNFEQYYTGVQFCIREIAV